MTLLDLACVPVFMFNGGLLQTAGDSQMSFPLVSCRVLLVLPRFRASTACQGT